MIKKTLVILFVGIFTSIVIPFESDNPQKNIFRNLEPTLDPIPDQSIPEEGTLEYAVIANDPDGDDLTFDVTLDDDADGEASFNDNNLIINPTIDFNGDIEVEVFVSDGEFTISEIFILTVTPVNDAPILAPINPVSFIEDQSAIITVDAEDVDENDTLTYQCNPSVPEVQCEVNGSQITFTSNLDHTGIQSATIFVSDGQESDSQEVTVTVIAENDAPVLSSINPISFDEGASETITVEATDIDSNTLFYGCTPNANINCTVFGNQITFEAFDAEYHGSGNLEVTVTDGDLTDSQMVVITINSINDTPVLDFIGPITFDEDQSEMIVANATDLDEDELVFQCSNPVPIDVVCDIIENEITFSGASNFFGADTITVSVTDGQDSDSQDVIITVESVNDAPVLDFIADISFEEDTSTSIIVSAEDVEEDILTYDCISSANIDCSSILGSEINFNSSNEWFGEETVTITVSDGFLDDSQDVTVTVTSFNDQVQLVAAMDAIEVNEDANDETIDLADHFNDTEDGTDLNYTLLEGGLSNIINNNIAGTILTIDFLQDQYGSGDVTLRACDSDGDCLEEIFSITVNPMNDAPDLSGINTDNQTAIRNYEYSFVVNPISDVDDTQFNFNIEVPPSSGTTSITPSGQSATFLWYPDADALEEETITIRVTDVNSTSGDPGTQQADLVLTVTVIESDGNTPPEIANIDNTNINEDGVFTEILTISDAEQNISELDVSVIREYQIGYPLGDATAEVNYDGVDWILTVTPDGDWNGELNIIVTANDGLNSGSEDFVLTIDPINDPPSFDFIDDGDIVFNEDSQITYDLYITDIDAHAHYNVSPDDVTETIDYVLTPLGQIEENEIEGTLLENQIIFSNETNFFDELNDLNQMTFVPLPDYYGQQNFRLTIIDAEGASFEDEFSVEVLNVNDDPIITLSNLTPSFDEDTVSDPIVASAEDDVVNPQYADSQNFTYSCSPLGTANVGCSVDGTSIIFENNNEHFFGEQDIRITVNDGNGGQDFEDITVTVNPINDAPVSSDFTIFTDEDETVTFNLLATDQENYELVYFPDEDNPFAPSNGELENNENGTVNYIPDDDFNGTDSLFFLVEDIDTDSFNNLLSDTAMVTIIINPVNDPPVLDAIADFDFDEDESTSIIVNATDIDEDPLTYSCSPQGTNIFCSVVGSEITFTSGLNYNGTETVRIEVSDGNIPDFQDVTVTVIPVNDAPIAEDIEESVDEDGILTFEFDGSDVDEGDSLSYHLVIDDLPVNGIVTNNDDGTATYTPNLGYNGLDSLRYRVNDQTVFSDDPPAIVLITVESINDSPVLDAIADFDFDEDESTSITVNATDIDEDPLTYSCSPQGANIFCSVVGSEITFTSALDYNGTETVRIEVSDGNIPDFQDVAVTVIPVNDAPIAEDIEESVDEDGILTFEFDGSDVDEGDSLSYHLVIDDLPANGIVTNNDDGTAIYTPNPEYNGLDSLKYRVNDQTVFSDDPPAVVLITVISSDDPPVLDNIDNASFDEDTSLTIAVSATDVEDDAAVLTYTCIPIDDNLECNVDGSDITFTAPENYNGTESVQIEVEDSFGNTDSQVIQIIVTPINDPPEILQDIEVQTYEEVELAITLDGFDIDGDTPLYYQILSNVTNGLLLDGSEALDNSESFPIDLEGTSINYRPNDNFIGVDSFTYLVNDGLLDSESSATVTITVVQTNDPPVSNPVSVTVLEGQSVTANFDVFDSEGDQLSISIVDPLIVMEDAFVGNNGDGTFTYAAPDIQGQDSFEYYCTDTSDAVSNIATVTVTILPSNDAPVLEFIPSVFMDEDTSETITVFAPDEEGDLVNYHCIPGDNILCIDNGDEITFTSAVEHWHGNETLIIYATDDNGAGGSGVDASSQEVVVVINPQNDTLSSLDVEDKTDEDTSLTISLFNYMINVDNVGDSTETVIYNIEQQGTHGNCIVDEDGLMTYTPHLDFPNTNANSDLDTCSFTISEATLVNISNESLISIEVLPINDNPVLDFIPDTSFIEDTSYLIELSASDVDDGDKLSFSCAPSDSIDCKVKGNILTGSSPFVNYYGTETITVYVEDDHGGMDLQKVNIQVTFENDPPELIDIPDIIFDEDDSIKVEIQAFDPDPEKLTSLQFYCEENDDIFCEIIGGDGPDETDTYFSYFQFSSTQDFNGSHTLTITVDDQYGRAEDSQEVAIIINPVNDAPITSNVDKFVTEDHSVVIDLLKSSTDVDNDPLKYSIVKKAMNGVCSIDGELLLYTPNKDYPFTNDKNGFDNCTYQASDGELLSNISNIDIEIGLVNDVPVADDIEESTPEDTPLLIDLSKYVYDIEDDFLEYEIVIPEATNGNCTVDDGIMTYTPNPGYPKGHEDGNDECTYRANDGLGNSNDATISIIVLAENDFPVFDTMTTCADGETLCIPGDGICDEECENDSNVNVTSIEFDEDVEDIEPRTLTMSATDEDGDELTYSCYQVDEAGETMSTEDSDISCVDNGDDTIILSATEHFNSTINSVITLIITVDDGYEGTDEHSVEVTVNPTPDNPFFVGLENLKLSEDTKAKFTITADDYDEESSLTFSCEDLSEEEKNIECQIDLDGELQENGEFNTIMTLTPKSHFYGSSSIEITVIDPKSKRKAVTDTITVEVSNINDPPFIGSSTLIIYDENDSVIETLDINDNFISFDEVNAIDDVKFIFNLSNLDSLANPDILTVTTLDIGFYSDELGGVDDNFNAIDLSSTCFFDFCEVAPIEETDAVQAICNLDCDENFSGQFVQKFIVTDDSKDDGSEDYANTSEIEVHLDVRQVNDSPGIITLENDLPNYYIDFNALGEEDDINLDIYSDITKFFVIDNEEPLLDSLVLKHTNPPILDQNSMIGENLYTYFDAINTSTPPSYYFIWNRNLNPYELDPDTDPSLNQFPYNLYYRLELINDGIAYVIVETIADNAFTGEYAYTLATIDPNALYPAYNKNDLYIPELSTNPTSSTLANINGGSYKWRIVAQNYNSFINGKNEIDCTAEYEDWNKSSQSCHEWENSDVISYNLSDEFFLDIKYTKGEYKFILNPLDIYVDHYDMYFIPDDQISKFNYLDYHNYSYLNYYIPNQVFVDESEELNYFNENNILQSIGSFSEYNNDIRIFVFTVDKHNNIYLNLSSLSYSSVLADQFTSVNSPSGDMHIEFNPNSFLDESRVLIYETPFQTLESRDDMISNLVNVTTNNPMNSYATVHFDFQYISQEYDPNHVRINQIIDDDIIELSTYVNANSISAEIADFGTFILSYNEDDSDSENMIPYEFGITSCYPNPFNPTVSIDYTIDIDSNIKLSIYNILGQKINVIDYGYQLIGDYTVLWNGTDESGNLMPSGVYFLEISNENSKHVKPVTLLK